MGKLGACAGRTPSRRAPSGTGRVLAGLSLAGALALSACTGQPPPPRASTTGCHQGPQRLAVSPDPAAIGQVVVVTASGSWHVPDTIHDVTTESEGLLGKAAAGHFRAIYNIAVIVPGMASRNTRVGSPEGLSGVGLPNKPFRIRVPRVTPGSYLLKFPYTVAPESSGSPKTYQLCAKLSIRG